jgi:hypothetical protein
MSWKRARWVTCLPLSVSPCLVRFAFAPFGRCLASFFSLENESRKSSMSALDQRRKAEMVVVMSDGWPRALIYFRASAILQAAPSGIRLIIVIVSLRDTSIPRCFLLFLSLSRRCRRRVLNHDILPPCPSLTGFLVTRYLFMRAAPEKFQLLRTFDHKSSNETRKLVKSGSQIIEGSLDRVFFFDHEMDNHWLKT